MAAAYRVFEMTRCNVTKSNGTAFGVGHLEFRVSDQATGRGIYDLGRRASN
jgi:hypothetical protein